MQGSFKSDNRARLDAIANVPWQDVAAGVDRRTSEAMRLHMEMERAYEAAPDDKRPYMSKVMPYPETPDKVFPATPCYRLLVDGRTRLLFVLDPGDANYPAGWDGTIRQQAVAHWVVLHFIYRDPV
jgi:hypothetical protein